MKTPSLARLACLALLVGGAAALPIFGRKKKHPHTLAETFDSIEGDLEALQHDIRHGARHGRGRGHGLERSDKAEATSSLGRMTAASCGKADGKKKTCCDLGCSFVAGKCITVKSAQQALDEHDECNVPPWRLRELVEAEEEQRKAEIKVDTPKFVQELREKCGDILKIANSDCDAATHKVATNTDCYIEDYDDKYTDWLSKYEKKEKDEAPAASQAAYKRMRVGIDKMIDAVHRAMQDKVEGEAFQKTNKEEDKQGSINGACNRKKALKSAAPKFGRERSMYANPKFDELEAKTLEDSDFGTTNQAVFREAFCASDIWRFTAEIKENTYTDVVKALRSGVEINFHQACTWDLDPDNGGFSKDEASKDPDKDGFSNDGTHKEACKAKKGNPGPKCNALEKKDDCGANEACKELWDLGTNGIVSMKPYKTKNYWKRDRAQMVEDAIKAAEADGKKTEEDIAVHSEWAKYEPLTDYTGINDVGYIEVPASVFELNPAEIDFLKTVRCDTFGKENEGDMIKPPDSDGKVSSCTDSQIDGKTKADCVMNGDSVRVRIELQYNTPDSLAVKDQAHAAYELYRVINPSEWRKDVAARAALYRWMSTQYDKVKRPTGAAWGVTKASSVSKCGAVDFAATVCTDSDANPICLESPKQHPVPFVIDRGEQLNDAAILSMRKDIEEEVTSIRAMMDTAPKEKVTERLKQLRKTIKDATEDASHWTEDADQRLEDIFFDRIDAEGDGGATRKICEKLGTDAGKAALQRDPATQCGTTDAEMELCKLGKTVNTYAEDVVERLHFMKKITSKLDAILGKQSLVVASYAQPTASTCSTAGDNKAVCCKQGCAYSAGHTPKCTTVRKFQKDSASGTDDDCDSFNNEEQSIALMDALVRHCNKCSTDACGSSGSCKCFDKVP